MSDDLTLDQHIGSRIRLRRRALGMTQNVLASALGVTFQQLQKYETGANRVSAATLWRVAGSLDVNLNYFFDGLGAQNRPEADEITRFLQTREGAELARIFTGVDNVKARALMLKVLRTLAAGL